MFVSPERLSVNQFVVPELTLDELCRACREWNVGGVGVLRSALEELGPAEVARVLSQHGVEPTSVCVIMGLTAIETDARKAKLAEALRTVEAASELGVPAVVVTGGPEQGLSLGAATRQAVDALAVLDARAAGLGTRVLLEPLHPMLVGLSAFTSLRQAAVLAGQLQATGVVLDTWHVWNEFGLDTTLAEHGSAIEIVHISDWAAGPMPATDRELPGLGIADVAGLCSRIGAATGDRRLWWEIEVLSDRLSRRYSQVDLLDLCVRRTRALL